MGYEIGSLSGPPGSQPTIRKQTYMEQIGQTRETPVWERDDAPPGSTAESLLAFENGRPVRVAGPTHYVHLADGRIVGGYGGGTHYADLDEDGNQRVTRIVANHEG
jgi:hypothetical protein